MANKKSNIKRKAVALLLAFILSFSSLLTISVSALDIWDGIKSIGNRALVGEEEQITDNTEEKQEFSISAPKTTIQKKESVTLTANGENVVWSSSDESVATVDSQSGVVTGIKKGRAIITATETIGEETITASVEISVTIRENFLLTFLANHPILSYSYSYKDDYYFTDKDAAWQHNFGYSGLYDFVAPYLLMEYDYVRVHFTYEGKDWLIQLWKGQYGLVFYGGECGVYNKTHSDKKDTPFTFYQCAPNEDRLMIQTSLYHDKSLLRKGEYKHEFTTPYESTWWSTGFKPGHLEVVEPANELRQTGLITLKDEEMTKLFSAGLKDCGFTEVSSKESICNDSFFVDGNNVYYQWQEISGAENTMGIKIAGGTLIAINVIAVIIAVLLGVFLMFGGIMLFIIII